MLKFAIGEIRKHRTPRDLWIAYQNKVYDLSAITEHDPELLQALAHRGQIFE
jgi:cytochrome b involved in lipid metabolism